MLKNNSDFAASRRAPVQPKMQKETPTFDEKGATYRLKFAHEY